MHCISLPSLPFPLSCYGLLQILFLNKADLFKDKIQHSDRHLRLYFTQYTGEGQSVCVCVRACACVCVCVEGFSYVAELSLEYFLGMYSCCCLE